MRPWSEHTQHQRTWGDDSDNPDDAGDDGDAADGGAGAACLSSTDLVHITTLTIHMAGDSDAKKYPSIKPNYQEQDAAMLTEQLYSALFDLATLTRRSAVMSHKQAVVKT